MEGRNPGLCAELPGLPEFSTVIKINFFEIFNSLIPPLNARAQG
jgi:hypothetical protein